MIQYSTVSMPTPVEFDVLQTIATVVSLLFAACALAVAAWQVRSSALAAKTSNSIPILSEAWRELRSSEFRRKIDLLLEGPLEPTEAGKRGLDSLPEPQRSAAYDVAYLFDYLGSLLALGAISEEHVISTMGTVTMRTWEALENLIRDERQFRLESLSENTPPGFLTYYEHLACRIVEMGGAEAAILLQKQQGVLARQGSPQPS